MAILLRISKFLHSLVHSRPRKVPQSSKSLSRPSSMTGRAYSTQNLNRLTRGDVVLFQGDFEGKGGDVVQQKNRPNIVISTDQVMEVTKRVILAPLSTAPARHEFEIIIPSNALTGIHTLSKVMPNQIRTAALDDSFIKVGSAHDYLSKINQAVATCLGAFKITQPPGIAQGDIVEIDFGSFTRTGIVVSNDIGNRASKIATLVHALHKIEDMNEFDLVVTKGGNCPESKLGIRCSMINTFPQGIVNKKGHVFESDMQKIMRMVYKSIGINS